MSSPAASLLHQYLHQLVGHGQTHVKLTDDARARLALGARENSGKRKSSPASTADCPAPPLGKAERLAAVRTRAAASPECRSLGTLRDTMVFAVGSPDAQIMFIGEAPGAEEEKQTEPFVGPAGQLLTKIILAMGLTRDSVYISNICKYRPKIEGAFQGSKNRPPSAEEMAAGLPYIQEEIAIIQPRVIVALGSTASSGLGIEGSVGRLRGRFESFQGIPVMVTYHPSFLLRREQEDGGGIAEKRMVWEDMLLVMKHIGLPISEKQRGYFTKARG